MRMKGGKKLLKFHVFPLFMLLFMIPFIRFALFEWVTCIVILSCDKNELRTSNFCVFSYSFAQLQFNFYCSDVKASTINVYSSSKGKCCYWRLCLMRDPKFSLHSFLSLGINCLLFKSNFCLQWLFFRSPFFHCFMSALKCHLQNGIIKQMSIISGFICSHKQQSKYLYEGKPNWTVINNPKFPQQDKLLKNEWPKGLTL